MSSQTVLNKENFLLICLMKLKLRITYSALSVFFKVHRTTVSRIFVECLQILSKVCKNLIFFLVRVLFWTLCQSHLKKTILIVGAS